MFRKLSVIFDNNEILTIHPRLGKEDKLDFKFDMSYVMVGEPMPKNVIHTIMGDNGQLLMLLDAAANPQIATMFQTALSGRYDLVSNTKPLSKEQYRKLWDMCAFSATIEVDKVDRGELYQYFIDDAGRVFKVFISTSSLERVEIK